MCLQAVRLGIKKIGVTDHLSFFPGDPNYGRLDRSYLSYFNSINTCRKEFKDRLQILMGVEVDYHIEKTKEIRCFLKNHPFDYVLVSVHYVNGVSLMDEEFYISRSPELGIRQYIKTLQQATTLPEIDVIAHLDWIKRGWKKYWPGLPYRPQILLQAGLDLVLKKIIEQGAILEINTSGARRGVEEPFPGKLILSRYREMGGTRCVLGSDAHRADELADGIWQGLLLAQLIGLRVASPLERKRTAYFRDGKA